MSLLNDDHLKKKFNRCQFNRFKVFFSNKIHCPDKAFVRTTIIRLICIGHQKVERFGFNKTNGFKIFSVPFLVIMHDNSSQNKGKVGQGKVDLITVMNHSSIYP